MPRRRRRRRVPSSSEESSEESSSESSDSSDESSSLSESSSEESSSEQSSESESDFDDSRFPDEDPKKTLDVVRGIIKEARVMKFENAIIERAGIDSYAAMRNCDDRKLKKIGMGYAERERVLKKFREHIDQVVERNRERHDRQREIKHEKKLQARRKKGKGKKSKRGKSKSSRGKGKTIRNRKASRKSSKSSKSSRKKIDPDEALRKLDTGWSGKRQAWADFKQHEARVAELMEFYDEIGKKRSNGEEHARKLLLSYPGGIHKLVIALEKKYNHIPYGWEELLEEAYRQREYEESGSD